MPDKISVLLADDHRSYVEGLTALFRDDNRIEFCGFVHRPSEVLEMVKNCRPDVVLLDYSFGENEPDGIELAGQLLEKQPGLKIILLTSYDDVPLVASAFSQGICGYLLKTRSRAELKTAIEAVAAGFEIAEAGVLKKIVRQGASNERKSSNPDLARAAPLTPSEFEIALFVAEGQSTQQIAGAKHLSTNTIDTHRKNIYSKLDVHNVAELIRWLRERELV